MPSLEDLISVARSFPSNSPLNDDAWQKLHDAVPEKMSYADLLAGIENLGHTNPRATLLAILACLKGRMEMGAKDEQSVRGLCNFAATAVAPCCAHQVKDDEDVEEPTDYNDTASRSREASIYGLDILHMLDSDCPAKLDDAVLLTLISFTDPSEPWTTEAICALATSLLDRQLSSDHHIRLEDLLVEVLLKGYLRPLFSKSRPNTVTPSGRKAAFQDEHDPLRGLSDETAVVKPWKYLDHRAIPALHFAVRRADETLISKQWPLFIPVILTLLDDTTTRIRTRGLVILDDFLSKFPNNILRDTGLASVFEDAVFPTLHFLPNITPEAESLQLLVPAYSALLTLAGKVNDGKAQTGKHHSDMPRAKLLDKILREGIFSAYFHAKEHICIVEVLLVQTTLVLNEMGIYAVKHLKDLIPMHSEIMTNPFAALAPSTLLAAIASLQATMANCWPRLSTPAYQSELIKALVVCFLTIQDDQDKLGTNFSAVEAELIKTAAMLSAIMKSDGGEWEGQDSLQEKVAPLIAKEPLLQKLFQ